MTFEFAEMDPALAEDLLAQVMEQQKQGTVSAPSSEWR